MSTRKSPKPTEQQQHDNAEAAPDDDMRDRSAEEARGYDTRDVVLGIDPATDEGLVMKGRRTVNGVTGLVFGPAGAESLFREPEDAPAEDAPAEDDAEVQAVVDELAELKALGIEPDFSQPTDEEALEREAAELAAREQRVVDILLDLVRVANGERGEHGAITFSDFARLVIAAVEQ